MTLDAEAWQAIALTAQLAAVSTGVLLLLATPLAWWLAWSESRWRPVVMALATLPLVLPPTVLGFYILVGLGPNGPLGGLLQSLGVRTLAFSFPGLVIGATIGSLPFAVQPIHNAFVAMGRRPLEVAATLRASPPAAFFKVALPLAWPGLLTAAVLSFAHTVGEFGVVLMIGGNIPGETRVVSTLLFSHVEAMDYDRAHALAAVMLLFSFVVLLWLALMQRRGGKP
jgi:molybdate transport system permease protein